MGVRRAIRQYGPDGSLVCTLAGAMFDTLTVARRPACPCSTIVVSSKGVHRILVTSFRHRRRSLGHHRNLSRPRHRRCAARKRRRSRSTLANIVLPLVHVPPVTIRR